MELTLNIRYMGQEADRGLKFLHDLDIGYENLHNFFEVFSIFACSFTAHFSKVPKHLTGATSDMIQVET